MNGSEVKIEIFKPFGEAFELMKKILFQPFDFKKWLVIGFAAWLANLGGGGGVGFNYRYSRRSDLREINEMFRQIPHSAIVIGASILIALVLILFVVFTWLRARGRFMFTDCIVKNRGAITEPWAGFRKEGNSYFLFSLLSTCVFLVFAGLLSLPFMLPIIRGVTFLHMHDVYLLSMIILWGLIVLLVGLIWALIMHLMVPVMYRRRCHSSEAFIVVGSLIATYLAEIVLYCLFLVVLALASAITGCVVTCATCCIAALPYVGSVILLPVFVTLRSFLLYFLRQFGPDYDVWEVIPRKPPSIPPPLFADLGGT